ncbi:hypothetical protein [Ruminococcus sp.]|uniref:hypothetical protein n=1 Tax=Ruminococcus sp. TaxID=41978 RepID=UPI001B5CF388|nr:hypothetical protein [Ruminococcus sp.]MBP5432163.1 hypothetical protein [Ruminococcus sp.]
MIINGKWMSEPEIIALISQLTADKEKLERQLDEAKRLLLLANADIYCFSDGKWEHEADVLKLIGDETNEPKTIPTTGSQ